MHCYSEVAKCSGRGQWYGCYYPQTLKRSSGLSYAGFFCVLKQNELNARHAQIKLFSMIEAIRLSIGRVHVKSPRKKVNVKK